MTLWQGTFEGKEDVWLRWCNQSEQIIPTGKERAEQAELLLAQERQRAELLAEQLRALGVEPDQFLG